MCHTGERTETECWRENRALKGVGVKRDERTEQWRELHHEELHGFYVLFTGYYP